MRTTRRASSPAKRSLSERSCDEPARVGMDTRYSREQVELRSATAALLADLAPRTVADLDDEARQGAPRQGRGVCGMVRVARSRRRRRPAGVRRRGCDRGPRAGAGRGRHARSSARWSPPTSPGAPGAELGDGGTSGGARPDARSISPSCPPAVQPRASPSTAQGSTRGLLLAPDGDDRLQDRRGGPRRRGAGDRSHARARGRSPWSPTRRTRRSVTRSMGPGSTAAGRLALAITVADLVGTMEGVLDTTCEYAKERHQYGVAIGSFQAVQHLLAEARVPRGRFDQRGAVRGLGGRRAAAGLRRWKPARSRRRTARAPPAPCARPPSRCTAGSATPGSASCTCTSAARCCRARCSATRATTCARWHAVDWEYGCGL